MTRAADLLDAPPLQLRWRNRRISETCQLINGFPFASEDFADAGDVPLVRIRDILATDFETYVPRAVVPPSVVIRKDDLVIGMDGDYNTVLWHREPAALNQRVCLLRPRSGTDIRFIAYALPDHLRVVNDLTYSTTVKHLSSREVLEQLLPMPGLEEQRRIANYLDRETGQIDALIAEQEQLVETLTERRQAVIAQAVTRGLDSTNQLKDSGVEWIGPTPPGWSVTSVRAVVGNVSEKNNELRSENYLSLMANVGVILYADKGDIGNKAPEDLTKCKMVRAGDLVINSMNYGIGSYGVSPYDGICSSVYLVLRAIKGRSHVDFVRRIFEVREFQRLAQSFGNGILEHRRAINWDSIKNLRIALPPFEIQKLLASEITRRAGKIDALIAKAREMTAVLRERRQALISAAVTGKIDVRGL